MGLVCVMVGMLLGVVLGAGAAGATSFPAAGDATLAEQQRWGSFSPGYIADGCWHAASAAGTTVTIASCRAFALETDAPEALKGFEDTTPRAITYSGGDGTYWLGGRANTGDTMGGWTCGAGTHYCWLKQETPPVVPSGMLLLGKTTVTSGAISAFVVQAPWRRTTPYPVPAGTTITLGACPHAGPVHIFDAMGDAGSGAVDFAPWACQEVYPEWWGADPTGAVDATLPWRRALLASKPDTPIVCQGVYALSATQQTAIEAGDASNNALTLTGLQQILGKVSQVNFTGTANLLPCRLEFTGTGNAIGTLPGMTNNNILLKNVHIWDKGGEGNRGLDLWQYAGSGLDHVYVNGFHTGMWVGAYFYYGYMYDVGLTNGRVFCADLSGGAFNGTVMEIECESHAATLQTGIRLGSATGYFGTGNNSTYKVLIETSYGIPLSFSRQNGFRLTAYIEQYGVATDHDPVAAAWFAYVKGGDINIRLQNSTADAAVLPVGVRVINTSGSVDTSKHLRIYGHVSNRYTLPLIVDNDAGTFAIDASQLAVAGDALQQWGAHAGGLKIANNVITHGGSPGAETGRGASTGAVNDSVWRVGDVVWQSGGATAGLTNVLRIVNAEGNPPAGISSFMLDSLTATVILAAATTPSVKTNQIWNTRFNLEAGADITDFIDEISGMCIVMRALGSRTIKTGPRIQLSTTDFLMTTNDVLHLCIDGGVWREYARVNYP